MDCVLEALFDGMLLDSEYAAPKYWLKNRRKAHKVLFYRVTAWIDVAQFDKAVGQIYQ